MRPVRTRLPGLLAAGSALVSVAVLSGCTASLPDSSASATLAPSSSAPRIVTSDFPNLSGRSALLRGTLTVDADGCVQLTTEGDPVTLVWPEGYTVRGSAAFFEVLDASGALVVDSADAFAIGGGVPNAVTDAWRDGDCATGALWIAGPLSAT